MWFPSGPIVTLQGGGGTGAASCSNYSGCTVSHSPLASVKSRDTQADVMRTHGGEVQEKGESKESGRTKGLETKERVHLLEAAESKPRGWK
ncbi:hypothetical protein EYF80_065961 [Liparis tanakae]|uniref:Uncharacterized protein n=1 Tax=Liparis tanakae TaxID=230148 RepID=A0A4Z2E555_9TELE|nr:hypothetical protein EYF80_065961 [Liparis tanakae]